MDCRKGRISVFGYFADRLVILGYLFLATSLVSVDFQLEDQKQQVTIDESCVFLRHTFTDDSLETINLVECQTVDGLTNWFSSDINKSVCSSKQCRMINIRLFWDGVGNYHHFELIDKEPLTKTDHAEFSADDYDKLHLILSDSSSVFKDLEIEDLVIEKRNDVDGISGATRKSLSDYVVQDAVYTCYALWKIVYGPGKNNINGLLKQRVNQVYLSKLFKRNDPAVDFWVLNTIIGNPQYPALFFKELIDKVSTGDERISDLALRAIPVRDLNREVLQKELVNQIPKVNELKRLAIIWKLNDCPVVYDAIVKQLLQYYQKGILNPTALNYVYKLISGKNILNPDITKKLKEIRVDKNQYVRNITNNLLIKSDLKQEH